MADNPRVPEIKRGPTYREVTSGDKVAPPEIYLEEMPYRPGNLKVPAEIFFSREQHQLEVDRLWSRVWQLACHEDDIPNPGDVHVYDIAGQQFLIVRDRSNKVRAYRNSCRHRGRLLCDGDRKGLRALRCPFHGWTWNLEGKVLYMPCEWDFPDIDKGDYSLNEAKVGHWGGFVFINPDLEAEPLADFLGDIDRHFGVPFEQRFKAAHVVKRLPCNWKVAQEAFMESYHVAATHPELLPTFSDTNSKYDVFGNVSRAISFIGQPSPYTGQDTPTSSAFPDGKLFTSHKHSLTGDVYRRIEENRVEVTSSSGSTGVFDMHGRHLEGDYNGAEAHLCNWVGGKIVAGEEETPMAFTDPTASAFRQREADQRREELRPQFGSKVDEIADTDLVDPIFYSVFPNISPWADFNPIFYRFRPDGDNPEQCFHEIMYMVALPEGAPRPEPAECQFLDLDDDYTQAPQLGTYLAKIFNQDFLNMRAIQQGLHNAPDGMVTYSSYQETKIRHFHDTLSKWLEKDVPRSNS
ncbi:aromatic ring-hydroxylating oxygenase subunit alpha [Rhizorhapis sp. SPR117]|uniref:aromatic ring-hydroxylating oxygenase subunit alpha n=1 Tax=Rhizorhapis sp. SPR117 TaxID=2912611 RepID=UPI001F47433D|nr:aromatic ring-hydroxylating dioxygenase subunit alpha [Rhizorhapis sp. SPR117]